MGEGGDGPGFGGFGPNLMGYDASIAIPQIPFEFSIFLFILR
jgi:hypothetical protein